MKHLSFRFSRLAFLIITLAVTVNHNSCAMEPDSTFIKLDSRAVDFNDEITVTFQNFWDQDIRIVTSGCSTPAGDYLPKLEIERKSGEQWVHAAAPVCIAIATPPIILGPDETVSFTFPVNTGFEEKPEDGLYRYKFDIRSNGRSETEVSTVPNHFLVSESFRINN